ncbi:hypothetical protein D6201_10095 [Aurantiacibacter aquimixticola]|uniref:Uncharacterized protein n=1 Tax=Aurantiacibacter aquimixticola TaxID=1958945 RepID=A0A419RX25_9SPHN|nr:hypothetical protein D6201_10095 [Aurantiacibacter aquimixticola]
MPSLPGTGGAPQPQAELPEAQAPTYADLVTFARAAPLVAIVTVDDQAVFPVERAPDLAPGRARLYLESLTRNLLTSPTGVGESLTFVTDVDRDADGDAPDLEEQDFIVFASLVPGRPGEVQLVSSRAILAAGPSIEERVRRVLRQLAAADSPPTATGVRDVISVPGNLAGESETQMFVETARGAPVSLSVVRRPGQQPQWGVSFGEIVDSAARPPAPETLEWFALACFLPRELPESAFLQADSDARQRARADYAFVLEELGRCERRFT